MRPQRLVQMGIPEIVYRSRQEASKWLERTGLTQKASSRACPVLDLGRFFEIGPGRFFAGAVSGEAPILLRDRVPDAHNQIVAAAEAVCKREFDLLGYHKLYFGDPVDWRLDPLSKRRSPFVHWSRLDPLDPTVVGDSKVIWELNRHQWLVRLGQAYRLTGNEHYAEMFSSYIREWIRANPPGMGINWASSLEVALRLISWCWALFLFRGSKALSQELFMEMLRGIWSHASHAEKYLSYYFAPNTHLTGEALGLFYAGVVFPELPPAEHWRELGAQILVEQITRQVLPDGVYFEQSTCYQRYTVETYLHFLILAERNGVTVPAALRERIQWMLDFLLAMRQPDGSMPQIGDADGGWTLPLASRVPEDLRGIFSTAAALWSRPDYAWAAGSLAPETLWLLGEAGLKAFESIRPDPPTITPSCLFTHGGYAVMRSGWEKKAHHLIFDVGTFGCPAGGHGHADLLSIQCSVFGQPYLVDPGTYCYTADLDWRNYFRSTAHSTIRVDHAEQAIPAGPFKWQSRPQAKLRRWFSTKTYDLADAEHDAYRYLSDPVVHRRRVLFVKPRYWVVVDDLEGAAEHHVELRFQFAPMKVTVDSDRWTRAQGPGGRGLLIRAFAKAPLKAGVYEGEIGPIQGWVSSDYGQRQPAPVLIYTTTTTLPLRIVTVLIPVEKPFVSPPVVSLFVGKRLDPVVLFLEDWKEIVLLLCEQEAIIERW